jgi:hypothetical protein
MATDHILSLLISEREKLNQAIEALQGSRVAPVEPPVQPVKIAVAEPAVPKKRKLSAAGRRAIIEGTKKRWAALNAAKAAAAAPAPTPAPAPKAAPVKAAAKKKAAPAKNAAFRKQMSDRMKAAWATRKKKAASKKK